MIIDFLTPGVQDIFNLFKGLIPRGLPRSNQEFEARPEGKIP